ncbi:SRPBCC family protein [Roseibium sediminicola]|uniref:SRPBCC domain-containing protein n=1 Tax=Roseibium sediminicola TaxID=2933272 RepID=A0ABT0H027_9HYPH|nr:SRPBCC domain-containing protein [Roseibium sp. CAU 1639]MCK7614936.1 SRPBCC domain-containing protein [Roseibium sp. CAU 1639]
MTTTHTVLQTRVLNSSTGRAWDAWTKPELMKQWFCPLGMKAIEVEADFRLGGTFRIVMDASGAAMRPPPEVGDHLTAYGSYQRIEPPHELAFSWAWEGREETSRVTITMTPKGDKTVLVLEHDGLMDEASRIFHENGWTPTLENLARHLNTGNAWNS